MTRLLISTAAIALLSGAAVAADLPVYEPAPVIAPVPVAYDWSGFYVGGFVGHAWGGFDSDSGPATHELNDFADPLDDTNALLAGGTIGYNAQWGRVVAGLEADLAWSNVDEDFITADPEWHADLNWLGTVRPRLGFAFDRFLPFITGGLAVGDIDLESFDNVAPPGGGSDSEIHWGWTVGAGAEVAVTDRFSIKAEYNYVDLGQEEHDLSGPASFFGVEDLDFTAHIVKLGANFHF